MRRSTRICFIASSAAAALSLSGCADTVSKLQQVGKLPPHAAVADPIRKPDYQPLSWPLPEMPQPSQKYANSLWQPGARAFFRDQRASRVGDILKVTVQINDQILTDNESEGKRQAADALSAPAVLGLERKLFHGLSRDGVPDPALSITGNRDTKSTGKITRQDQIRTQVSALVTQILPNGNLVIEGSQELLMNYEMRQVGIKGVVRPQDISSDNTVDSSQVAEARITYSGHGQLMDMMQPRWGSQVVDIIAPF